MAAIQFPNNPNAGDLFTASNGIRYTYDGEKWKTLGTSTVGTEGQFLETPIELTIDKVIPGNTNTGAVGSLAVGAGVTLTVPSTSSFRTLSGKTGTYGVPETGGTFTGPVSFDDNTIIKGNSNDGSGALTLNCENNSHGVKIKGPPHSAGANYTLVLPNDTGTSGQVLTTNGSGVSSWSSVLPLTGGTLTGSLTGTTANFSGNVGIGTTSPLALYRSLSIHGPANDQGGVLDLATANQSSRGYVFNDSNGLFVQTATNHDIVLRTNNTERMRIDSSGFVGIGESSPSSYDSGARQLVVKGSTNAGMTIRSASNKTGSLYFADGTTGNEAYRGRIEYNHTDDRLQLGTAGSGSKLVIDSSGNVGIGTPSPGMLFEVNSPANDIARFTGPNSGNIVIRNATNHEVILHTGNSDALVFGTNGNNERMRIDSSGKILVGTSSNITGDLVQIKNTAGEGIGFYRNSSASGIANGRVQFRSSIGITASIFCLHDGGQSAGSSPGALVFSTTAPSSTSETPRMQLNSDGTLGVFTNSGAALMIGHAGGATTSTRLISARRNATGIYGGTEVFAVTSNGNAYNANNSYGSLSDEKLKENIVNANSQWSDIKELKVRNYNFKEGQTHTQIGLIAQEVEPVSPGLVSESTDQDEEGNDLGTTTKSVNYSVLYMKAVKALQEAMDRIETLEQRLSDAGIA